MSSAKKAREAILEKKGVEPVILDVRELSNVTDYYVIAAGNNAPHLRAIAEQVEDSLKAAGAACYRRSGKAESGWMVADFFDVVVHVFSREARDYYGLEQLWNDAPRVGE